MCIRSLNVQAAMTVYSCIFGENLCGLSFFGNSIFYHLARFVRGEFNCFIEKSFANWVYGCIIFSYYNHNFIVFHVFEVFRVRPMNFMQMKKACAY